MIRNIVTILALFAFVAAGQTLETPVQFEYQRASLATEVTFQNGAPILSNYQTGIMLSAYTKNAEVNAFVAFVQYVLPGADKVLHKQMFFPKTPNTEHGATSTTFGTAGEVEIRSISVFGVRLLVSAGFMFPQPGIRYLVVQR